MAEIQEKVQERDKVKAVAEVYQNLVQSHRNEARKAMVELQDRLSRGVQEMEWFINRFDSGEDDAAGWAADWVAQLSARDLYWAYASFQKVAGVADGMKTLLDVRSTV